MDAPKKIMEWTGQTGAGVPELHLFKETLESVLSKAGGKKLVVLSILGPVGKGKSFLMSLIVRYLEFLEKNPCGEGEEKVDWMFNKEPLRGFPFEDSIDLVTSGIQMWGRPFFVGDLALILIDTPGIFEPNTSLREWAGVAGTILLLSSCCIFNIAQNLQEDSLLALETFMEYGKLIGEGTDLGEGGLKAFQKVMFLIRDWSNAEFSFGDGSSFLEKKLGVFRGMSAESGACREFLRANVEEMACFLVPHPEDSEMEYDRPLDLDCLDRTFAETLKQFVVSLLEPSKIKPKMLRGNPIGVQEFLGMTENYVRVFNSSFNFPVDVTNISIRIRLEMGMIRQVQNYKAIIKRKLGKKSTPKQSHLDKHHIPLKSQLLQEFKDSSKCDPTTTTEFLEKLNERVDSEYQNFSEEIRQRQQSVMKMAQEDALNVLTIQLEQLTISERACPAAFEGAWGRAREAAKKSFDSKIGNLVEQRIKEDTIAKIQTEFVQLYEKAKARNEYQVASILRDNDAVIQDAVSIYLDKIDSLVDLDQKAIMPEKLAASHQAATITAKSLLERRVKIPSNGEKVYEILLQILSKRIDEEFKKILQKNHQELQAVKAALNELGTHMIDRFKDNITKILDSGGNPNSYGELLQQAHLAELEAIKKQVRSSEVRETKILKEFQEQTQSKLKEAYEEAVKLLESKIQDGLRNEKQTVDLSVMTFSEHLESLKLTTLAPEDFVLKAGEGKQNAIDSCRRQLESMQSSQIEKCIHNLLTKIDVISEAYLKDNQSRYESLLENLQKLVDDYAASFQQKLSNKIISPACFTQAELNALVNTISGSALREFASHIAVYDLPTEQVNFEKKLQQRIRTVAEQEISNWESYWNEQTEKLTSKKNEEAKSKISAGMQEMSKYDILTEDEFREKFDKLRNDFLSGLRKELVSYKNLPETSFQHAIATVTETLTSLDHKQWAGIIKKNRESEERIGGRISALRTEYFNAVLANMEPRPDIFNRFISNFSKEFRFSNPGDLDRYRQRLKKELASINDQLDSDESHALHVEQTKQDKLAKFSEEILGSENLNEEALDELIALYARSFSDVAKNAKVLNNFQEDLQHEKARVLKKRQQDAKVAQMEKLLTLLSNEYRSLLEKRGSSQNNQIKQQTFKKLEASANKLKMEISEYRARLEESMENILEECIEKEKYVVTEEKLITIIENLLKVYREEMAKHFQRPKYYSEEVLHQLHLDAVREAIGRTAGARSDDDGIRKRVTEALNGAHEEFLAKNAMNAPTSFAIGIDLGTTYSCVGVYMNGEVEIIPNDLGQKTTPSYVYYAADGGVVVGEVAKKQSHAHPERTIYEVKRLIGRDISDPAIQGDIAKWPFKVVSERGIAKVQVGEATVFPEEVSAEILRKLKRIAEEHLNRDVTAAVITVPAYFTDGQKAATKMAGQEAGLDVLRIISEPTAAAIAYNLNWAAGRRSTKGIVYDLGGGTFDVALFTATGGDIKIISVGGDTHLGGVDFDNELVVHCCKEFQKSKGIDLLADQESKDLRKRTAVNRKLMRLKRRCERYKIDLTMAEFINVVIEAIHGGLDMSVHVTQKQFEGMIDKYIDKSLEEVQKVLSEAQMSKDDIEEIVLIGGSTRIPRVRKRLMEFFEKGLNTKINPDEAVAVGAAYEAAVLNGRRAEQRGDVVQAEFAPRGFSIKDVTPMAYGIEIEGGDMCILIPNRSQVPTEVSKDFLTAYHHQTSVQIVIYEGQNPKARDNTLVGEFYLNGIPEALAGRQTIRVTMTVNPEGMITVAATSIGNGVRKELTVRANKRRMGTRERIRHAA